MTTYKLATLLTVLVLLSILTTPRVVMGENTSKLQQLINEAKPYDVLEIPPGTYYGPIVVDKPLTLVGRDYPTIDGQEVSDVVVIEANDVVLDGFRIINSNIWYGSEAAGVKIRGNNSKLINNIFEDTLFGIYIEGAYNTTVANNTILGMPQKHINDRGHGIYLWYAFGSLIINNTIREAKDGIYNEHSYYTKIIQNKITKSRYGIHLMYSANYEILNNTVVGNLVGMALMYSQNLTVKFNMVGENKGMAVSEGIFLRESGNVTLEYNMIYGHYLGLDITYSPYPPETTYLTVKNNTVAFNYVGVSLDVDSRGEFYGNNFVENLEQVMLIGRGDTIAYWRGNFWSDYRGIEGQPYKAEDPLEDLMDNYPYLRIMMYSPAYMMLEVMKKAIPMGARVKAVDEQPRTEISFMPTPSAEGDVSWLIAAAALTISPASLIIVALRGGFYGGNRGRKRI